jgi:uncharacterized DUF497 family protein
LDYDWDDDKYESNRRKHGVDFVEATEALEDENAITIFDGDSDPGEERWVSIGMSSLLNCLVVVYCEREEESLIRIISARKANKNEEKQYAR